MKKVLITGAAGMIGSHLIDELLSLKKYKVLGVDDLSFGKIENLREAISSSDFTFYKEDVTNIEGMLEVFKDIDIIVHLAARKKISESQPSKEVLTINSKGTESILEIALKNNAKVVLASTSDCYGVTSKIPFNEDDDLVLGPSNIKRWAYAVSKLYDEQLAFAYYKDYGLLVTVLRYFGGFSSRSALGYSGGHVPMFIDAILKNKEIDIHGDGSQTRSMGYVADIVNGTKLAMESDNAVGEIINIGNDEEMSVLDCAKLIHRLANTGNKLKINFIPMNDIFGKYKDIKRRVPCLKKAEKILNYKPKWKFKDALELTINEHKRYLSEKK